MLVEYSAFTNSHLPLPEKFHVSVQLKGSEIPVSSVWYVPLSSGPPSHHHRAVIQHRYSISIFVILVCAVLNSGAYTTTGMRATVQYTKYVHGSIGTRSVRHSECDLSSFSGKQSPALGTSRNAPGPRLSGTTCSSQALEAEITNHCSMHHCTQKPTTTPTAALQRRTPRTGGPLQRSHSPDSVVTGFVKTGHVQLSQLFVVRKAY